MRVVWPGEGSPLPRDVPPLVVTHHALLRYRARFGIIGSLEDLEDRLVAAWAGPKCCVRIESEVGQPLCRHVTYVTPALRLGIVVRETPGGHSVYILTTVMEPIGTSALVADALAAGEHIEAERLATLERIAAAARACA